MKKLMMIVVMAAAIVLPAMAQFEQQEQNTAFQSTSTMQGSGSSYASTPVLNEDGTAAYDNEAESPKASSRGVRKSPGTPGNSGTEMPIGDAVLPLLLMAVVYAFVRYKRKQRFCAFAF